MVQNVRQTVTILAMDIITLSETSYFNVIGAEIFSFFLSHHILLRPLGNVIYILPPYCITDEELKNVYEKILLFLEEFGVNT